MTAAARLRILYPAALLPGGAERQMLLLATHLPRDRFEVTFILLGDMTPLAEEAIRAGAHVHALRAPRRAGAPLPVFGARVARRVLSYIELCRRGHFDVVDAWLYLSYELAAVTRPVTRVPVLITGRRSMSGFKSRFGFVERTVDGIARRSSDAVVANSEAVADNVARLEHIERSRIRVIRNGVEIPALPDDATRQALRAEWGIHDDRPVVGCVGTFKAGKGQATLVTVMAAIRERVPGAWLVFVGEGPLLAETQALAAGLGLERVRFLGTVHDPRALYHGFDAFVSASDSEGLPNVVLEAAAAARPIVATDAGGTREIVTDGSTGLLVPVGDATALGEGLVTILHDRDLAKRLGLAAREVAARDFGVERLVTQTAALYEELTVRVRHAG